jgi:hypothetical protein
MERQNPLDEINSEKRVNEVISRDEERPTTALSQAEALILELPPDHEGRREWLIRFGRSADAKALREKTTT